MTPSLDALRCSSSLSLQSVFPLLRQASAPATILDPSAVLSLEHLELAAALAEKSRADGTSSSERVEMEFLMWLACTPHADKAIARVGAKKNEDFVLVVLGEKADAKKTAAALGLEQNKTAGSKNAVGSPDAIGSISALSFFGVKTAEQLYEKMALSRI